MKRIKIGKGPETSAIGIGCMRFASLSSKEVLDLIHTSLESGIDLFDHADIYGGGRSEELFGEAMAFEPGIRSKIFLQSKCGIRGGYYDLSREHIIGSAEKILKRLQTDYLDMLLLHRPDTLMEPEEISRAFETLQTQGKVRYFGVSNMNPSQIELINSSCLQKIIANQLQFGPASSAILDAGINVNVRHLPGNERDASVLEYCRLKNITVQAWSPLQHGWFAGPFLGNEKYARLNEVLEKIGNENGLTPGAAAIAWILRHPAGMQAVLGSTKPERVKEASKALDYLMPREEWYEVYRAAGNELP